MHDASDRSIPSGYAGLISAFKPVQKALVATEPVSTHAFKTLAADDGVIIGIGSYAELVDLDGDVIKTGDLVRMAYDYCASTSRAFKANHKDEIDCQLVASWPGAPVLKSGRVLRDGEPLPSGDPVSAISLEKGCETAWFIAVRPRDQKVFEAAKAGDVVGFSWSGPATRTPKE
jgi:hypothetical protein